MALKKNWTLTIVDGISVELPEAYCRVDRVSGNKKAIEVNVGIYKEELSEVAATSFVCCFIPNLGGDNFIAQSYEYLKTLPEFADAEDC